MDIICNQESGTKRAIQYAIDALPAEGGRVIVPAGNWESRPIRLRSNVELHLETGAQIWFASNQKKRNVACIFADHASFVTISGRGILHGDRDGLSNPADGETCQINEADKTDDTHLPALIELRQSDHILLSDFCIRDSYQAAIHANSCHHMRLSMLRIRTCGVKTAGVMTDSCDHVEINACRLYTSGSGINICASQKHREELSGQRHREELPGQRHKEEPLLQHTCIPSRDIELRNCYFDHSQTAIEIGPFIEGGIESVYVKQCMIQQAKRGISIASAFNADGYLKNCRFENIQINHTDVAAIDFPSGHQTPEHIGEAGRPSFCPRNSHPVNHSVDFRNIELRNIYGSTSGRALSMEMLTQRQRSGIHLDNIALTPPRRISS